MDSSKDVKHCVLCGYAVPAYCNVCPECGTNTAVNFRLLKGAEHKAELLSFAKAYLLCFVASSVVLLGMFILFVSRSTTSLNVGIIADCAVISILGTGALVTVLRLYKMWIRGNVILMHNAGWDVSWACVHLIVFGGAPIYYIWFIGHYAKNYWGISFSIIYYICCIAWILLQKIRHQRILRLGNSYLFKMFELRTFKSIVVAVLMCGAVGIDFIRTVMPLIVLLFWIGFIRARSYALRIANTL